MWLFMVEKYRLSSSYFTCFHDCSLIKFVLTATTYLITWKWDYRELYKWCEGSALKNPKDYRYMHTMKYRTRSSFYLKSFSSHSNSKMKVLWARLVKWGSLNSNPSVCNPSIDLHAFCAWCEATRSAIVIKHAESMILRLQTMRRGNVKLLIQRRLLTSLLSQSPGLKWLLDMMEIKRDLIHALTSLFTSFFYFDITSWGRVRNCLEKV